MANPRHIYALRHCERVDDVNEVWYYNNTLLRDNPPLSDRGERQAEDLRKKFRNIHIDYCFSSPYERCVQTAVKILEGRGTCQINIEPGFLEAGFLVHERGAKEQSYEKATELVERYPSIDSAYKPFFLAPNEEEFREGQVPRCCFQRVQETMKRVIKICRGDILIVTHMHPLAAIQHFLDPGSKLVYPSQASVSKYEEQPDLTRFKAAFLSDESHLSEGNRSNDRQHKNHFRY